MPTPDDAADVVPRTVGTNLRIATLNVENLFSRAIALDYADHKKGQPYLDAFSELNSIFNSRSTALPTKVESLS
jgi:hypothetical protein